MSIWTLTTPDGEKSFADLGITARRRNITNQFVSRFSFTHNIDYDGQLLAPYKSLVAIKKDGVQFFYGRVINIQPSASSQAESIQYTIADPFWDLESIVFQKYRKVLSNPLDSKSALTNIYTSHFLLNLTADGFLQTIAQQLIEAIQYAIDQGAPLQLNLDALPPLFVPLDEVSEITCAEAIIRQLRWCPDASVWFDYSTPPPTLHIARRADLAVKTLDLPGRTGASPVALGASPGATVIGEIDIAPRYDLLTPACVIKYERTNELDGAAYLNFQIDAFPLAATGRELNALVATIPLEGTTATSTIAQIVSEPFGDLTSVAFWKEKCPELGVDTVKNLKITNPIRETALPNEFIDGQIADWMTGTVADETVQATATYDLVAADGITVVHGNIVQTVHARVKSTDIASGSYSNTEIQQVGELAPIGLAQALFVAASTLHYDGNLTLKEDECSGSVSVGQVLNLTNGRAAWATMNAQVQSIAEDIDSGKTSVTIGPPKFLGRDEIMALLRVTRNLRRITPKSSFTSGRSGGGGQAVLGKSTPRENTTTSQPTFDKFTVAETIVLDKADAGGRQIKLRQLKYCDNGVAKNILILASELF